MYLFQFSTCFEQPRAHHQENQLSQYNIWYMSFCVGDRFVCRSERILPTCTRNGHRHRATYTRCCIDAIDSPDDEHEVAWNMSFQPAHETVTDTEWHTPDVVLIQLTLLTMSTRLLETCTELK